MTISSIACSPPASARCTSPASNEAKGSYPFHSVLRREGLDAVQREEEALRHRCK